MAVGCLIYTDNKGKIYHRLPYWPWPPPGEYPQELPDGTWAQFFPYHYFRFALGDVLSPFPPVPYVSTKDETPRP